MFRMTGGQALVRCLVREGVEVIFGLPGVQIYGAVAAIRDTPGIRMISPRSEAATTFMADGYARAGGRCGVALVVPGPGVYNAAGGLSTAYAVSSPVLLIAGQIPRDKIGGNTGALHEVNDQIATIMPVTKWQTRVLAPGDVPGAVREAFHRLRRGRPRPVYMEIPPEALLELDEIELPAPAPAERTAPPDELIEEASKILASAENPLVLAGRGILCADAHIELQALAETYNLPVITSRGGKGALPDDHPLLYGAAYRRTGRLGEVFSGTDVLLAVGTRLAMGAPSPDSRVIRIDVDPNETGRLHANTLALRGDAGATLAKLHDALAKTDAAGRSSPKNLIRATRERLNSSEERSEQHDRFMNAIRKALPEEGLVIMGMTQLSYYSRSYWPVYQNRTFFDSGYSGNLGFAYPTALGAKVARPDRPVVCIIGDGGFGYHSTEMSTAVKYGINTVTVLFNDRAFGNVARDMDENFGGSYEAELNNPDYMKLAEAYGVEGIRVEDHSRLSDAVGRGIAADRPVLIEVPVETMPRPPHRSSRPAWAMPQE